MKCCEYGPRYPTTTSSIHNCHFLSHSGNMNLCKHYIILKMFCDMFCVQLMYFISICKLCTIKDGQDFWLRVNYIICTGERDIYGRKPRSCLDRFFNFNLGLIKMYRVTSVFFSPFPRISVSLKKV